jgi:hypothetical protein
MRAALRPAHPARHGQDSRRRCWPPRRETEARAGQFGQLPARACSSPPGHAAGRSCRAGPRLLARWPGSRIAMASPLDLGHAGQRATLTSAPFPSPAALTMPGRVPPPAPRARRCALGAPESDQSSSSAPMQQLTRVPLSWRPGAGAAPAADGPCAGSCRPPARDPDRNLGDRHAQPRRDRRACRRPEKSVWRRRKSMFSLPKPAHQLLQQVELLEHSSAVCQSTSRHCRPA